ncbi:MULTISPECIES: quinone oxidoreductase family protein [Kocuria]|uniref:Quinone oxidoreductase n=1 Tax=Kocuria subflava TaxID=1736139 RepID=A0A846TZH5_9MICC|nr:MULTISPECIES: quinone oxidoreductase [Kocuria]NKE09675.1 quinone oxidoreductase [Kocuria subflava]
MRAVRIHKHGGPEVLTVDDVDTPTPGPGQVLVRTARTGVNFIETYQREGVYDVELPFLLGSEGSGVVEAVGDGVTHLSPGQRVMTSQGVGTYAEYFLVNADQAVVVPDSISDDDAGALPLQGFTAHYLTRSTYAVGPETTAVITAAAGGVGGLAIQYMKQLGATVIGLTSSQDKAETARSLGADHVLPYDGFADAVLDLTDGQGADVVYDSVGKSTFDESLAATKTRGTVVLFGGASGQVPPFDLQRLNAMGSLYVTRPSLNAYLRTPEELQWRAQEMFQAIESGLTVRVGGNYTLEDAASAHTDLESRATQGKLLLTP